jgi:uncharacterized protein
MHLNEVHYDQAMPVQGYGPGFFRVGGQIYQGAMLATPNQVGAWGGLDDSDALLALAGDVDVVFLGTGSEIAHAPATLRAAIEGAGMGLEVMNTPAACRTYNVLLGEGRRVAVAAIPVG